MKISQNPPVQVQSVQGAPLNPSRKRAASVGGVSRYAKIHQRLFNQEPPTAPQVPRYIHAVRVVYQPDPPKIPFSLELSSIPDEARIKQEKASHSRRNTL